MHFIELNAQ